MQLHKRLTALLPALAIVLALTACSENGLDSSVFGVKETETAQTTAPTPEETAIATETAAPQTLASSEETSPVTSVSQVETDPDDTFADIGSPKIDTEFAGAWGYPLDYLTLLQYGSAQTEQLDNTTASFEEVFDGITLKMNLDLQDDGSYALGVDEGSAITAVQLILSKLSENVLPLVTGMMGMSEEELTAAVEAQGMTMEEFLERMEASLREQMNPGKLAASMQAYTQTGSWRCVDGKLYLVEEGGLVDPEQYVTVELRSGTLVVTGVSDSSQNNPMYLSEFPAVLTRR